MTVVSTARVRQPRVRQRRTQAERRAQSDRLLLQAAAELIVERGIEGTSLAEIGRHAGYSHGLVHHRFGSKDALVERLNEEAVRMFTTATVARVGDAQGALAVRVLAETYLRLVHGPDPIARVHLLVWSEAIAHGCSRRSYQVSWDRAFRRTLEAMISYGISDGSVRDTVDPASAAVIIVGLLRGVALQLILDADAGSTYQAQGAVLDHLDRMLRP